MKRWLFCLPGKCRLFSATCACCVQYMEIDISNDKMDKSSGSPQDVGWVMTPQHVMTYFTLKDDPAVLQEANLLSNDDRGRERRAREAGGSGKTFRVRSADLVLSKAVRKPPLCPHTSLNLLHVRTNNTLQSLKHDLQVWWKDPQSTSWNQYAGDLNV